jgi:phosphatidylserine/phosphatidylglycerophosphate/cardiolipin synthase-like enzyme
MKYFRLVTMFLTAMVLLPACDYTPRPLPPIETYFSPKGGVTDAVVREIDAAEQTIFVQAYSFTSAKIAEALVNAHRRGVVVHVILDRSNVGEKYSYADFLAHSGVPVLIDARHEIAHNKIMILDGQVVITGSFNFTKQAETSNAENLLVIRDRQIAERYLENWHDHEAHSEPYAGRGVDASEPPTEHRRGDHAAPHHEHRTQ